VSGLDETYWAGVIVGSVWGFGAAMACALLMGVLAELAERSERIRRARERARFGADRWAKAVEVARRARDAERSEATDGGAGAERSNHPVGNHGENVQNRRPACEVNRDR